MKRLVLFASALVLACDATDPAIPAPTIRFRLDAPLCGGVYTVHFATEDSGFGSHAFRIHTNAPDSVSRAYEIEPGEHVITATFYIPGSTGTTWPDTVMNFAPGDAHERVLELYCS